MVVIEERFGKIPFSQRRLPTGIKKPGSDSDPGFHRFDT
jgi:hypothetical protein